MGEHDRNLANWLVDGAVKGQSRIGGHVVRFVSEKRTGDCDCGGLAYGIGDDE